MSQLKRHSIICTITLLILTGLCSCRDTVRYIVDKYGAPTKEKPEAYHAKEGFSPGRKKTRGLENHDRYHYYISPDPRDLFLSQQSVDFYEYSYDDGYVPFDEEKYWKENQLEFPDIDVEGYYKNTEIDN